MWVCAPKHTHTHTGSLTHTQIKGNSGLAPGTALSFGITCSRSALLLVFSDPNLVLLLLFLFSAHSVGHD